MLSYNINKIMAHPAGLLEVNNSNDCQHASLTNKLPYYVRNKYSPSNKKKITMVETTPSEY